MRVAAYGHIVSGGNVMRSGYAELVSHFSTIIHNTDGWEYAGVYVDQGFGQTELKRLMADGRAALRAAVCLWTLYVRLLL